MKTALISLFTASLLAVAFVLSGRPFDAANFTALLFSTGLVAWTVSQYSRASRPLLVARPIRLPVPANSRALTAPASRLAA
ncbi:MAG: hypothetical protein WDM96_16860 [Lacunisphaera sp.]